MGMDTYKLRVMHCPVCDHQASHRAVSAFPDVPCPKCKGARLACFMDGMTRFDVAWQAARRDITQADA